MLIRLSSMLKGLLPLLNRLLPLFHSLLSLFQELSSMLKGLRALLKRLPSLLQRSASMLARLRAMLQGLSALLRQSTPMLANSGAMLHQSSALLPALRKVNKIPSLKKKHSCKSPNPACEKFILAKQNLHGVFLEIVLRNVLASEKHPLSEIAGYISQQPQDSLASWFCNGVK